MKLHRALALSAMLGVPACLPPIHVTAAFSSRFEENKSDQLQAIARRVEQAPHADGPDNVLNAPLLAAVRQTGNRAVVLFNLATGQQVWAREINVTSAPEILRDVVVVAAGNEFIGLDLRTGEPRWRVDGRSMPLLGAARTGDTILLASSLGTQGGSAQRIGRVLAVNAQTGDVVWTHDVNGIVGRPAAVAGLFFVPWDRQSVVVLDAVTGVEQARIHPTQDVTAWVLAAGDGVFYGSRGVYRLTAGSATGTREGSSYLANPLTNVPGDPPLYRDAFAPTSGSRTARERIRFVFRPRAAEGEAMAVERDQIYLIYYRFVVAVDARTGEVRWARAIGPDESAPADGQAETAEQARARQTSFAVYDIDGARLTTDALVLVGGDGTVRALDPATGAVLSTQPLGAQMAAVSMDLGGYRPSASGAAPAPPGNAREQMAALVRDPDNRLVPIRAYLVDLLAQRPEQEATRDLLELYRERTLPGALRQEVATQLRSRRNGAQFLVHALEGEESHYNFLQNRQAPPLDVIAPTLAAMGAREAVPVLLQHLLDHETPIAALPAVITAIADLGDASAIPQLQAFVQRYRSDSAFAGDRSVPLQSAAAGIFRLGDATARDWLMAMTRDNAVHEPVRTAITRLFEEERGRGVAQTEEQQLAEAREQLQGRVNALRTAVQDYPLTLTTDAFEVEWASHVDQLRECAAAAVTRRPTLNEVRVSLTLRSEPPAGLFDTRPPTTLPRDPTFQQRMEDVAQQTHWVEEHLQRLEQHRSIVRTVAYSPQDPEMQTCMNAILQPAHFPGFGHGVAVRTFQERISTVRTQAASGGTPGFGTVAGSSLVVPWFLVSSPSIDPQTGQLVQPAAGASTPGSDGSNNGSGNGNGTPWVPPPATPPSNGGGDAAHPWWEQ